MRETPRPELTRHRELPVGIGRRHRRRDQRRSRQRTRRNRLQARIGVAAVPWARRSARTRVGAGQRGHHRSGRQLRWCAASAQRWRTASVDALPRAPGLEIDHHPERVVEREDAVTRRPPACRTRLASCSSGAGQAAPRAPSRRRTSASHRGAQGSAACPSSRRRPVAGARAARRDRRLAVHLDGDAHAAFDARALDIADAYPPSSSFRSAAAPRPARCRGDE